MYSSRIFVSSARPIASQSFCQEPSNQSIMIYIYISVLVLRKASCTCLHVESLSPTEYSYVMLIRDLPVLVNYC